MMTGLDEKAGLHARGDGPHEKFSALLITSEDIASK